MSLDIGNGNKSSSALEGFASQFQILVSRTAHDISVQMGS
jgi:hypothetical protein